LAAVEVAPHPLLRVIIHRLELATHGARPLLAPWMLGIDIDPLSCEIQLTFDTVHGDSRPRR